VHLIDTAGLRESGDAVEKIGIARTWEAIGKAGAAILITDATRGDETEVMPILSRMPSGLPLARVTNKIDRVGLKPRSAVRGAEVEILLSAKTGEGVNALRAWLLHLAGWRPGAEGTFMARERHLAALREAAAHLCAASEKHLQAYELFAEDLRAAQDCLGRITGAVSADDLLGHIFSRFCIGK
jgi:tRNA modification GTPase